MSKKIKKVTFDEVLSTLGNERFDVAPAAGGAKGIPGARRISKYGCSAEIAPPDAADGSVRMVGKAGWVLNGEIAHILDRGYQKFLATSKLQIPATADHLRCIHKFEAELKKAIGALTLYNESMGTTSDAYVYDRVKGRETV